MKRSKSPKYLNLIILLVYSVGVFFIILNKNIIIQKIGKNFLYLILYFFVLFILALAVITYVESGKK